MTLIDAASTTNPAPQLLLGAMPPQAALFRVRLRRSELAEVLGVDKATVTRWVQRGHLVFAPDGRVDAGEAIKQILRTADPRVLRVGLFRQAMTEIEALRAEAAKALALAAAVDELRAALASAIGERDRLAAQCADLAGYADDAAKRLAEREGSA